MSRFEDEGELFPERELRLALRLDATELPPRLDAAALVARARERSSLAAAALVSATIAVGSAAALVVAVSIALMAIAPELLADAYGLGLGFVASAAIPVAGLLDTFEQPTIPIAALAAVLFAIAYDYGQWKERAHVVHTS
jgi:hypothetical protein